MPVTLFAERRRPAIVRMVCLDSALGLRHARRDAFFGESAARVAAWSKPVVELKRDDVRREME